MDEIEKKFAAVTFDGEFFCEDCLPVWFNPKKDTAVPVPIDTVFDEYPQCDLCGYYHDYFPLRGK